MLRVYTVRERERFLGRPASLAGNFAVKEAVAKLLGTGFRGFGPLEIEVLREALCKSFRPGGGTKKRTGD